MNPKQLAGEKAVDYVKSGMKVGLGTGSTAYFTIQEIGRRVKHEGLDIEAIATSIESERLAKEWGVKMVDFSEIDHLDVTIDGADEADANLNLIKGGGGALLREKIVAFATKFYVIVADERKYVPTLGAFGLPIEIIPFGWEETFREVTALGCTPKRREKNEEIFITDNHNFIFDCDFGLIENPHDVLQKLQGIPGVVESGLFLDKTDVLIIGNNDGTLKIIESKK
ncbi:ribose-5-phosphate isomerase RpiA [Rhizosphaericola mali]|uniref:Ribose-5-phosphate isomerase A n=1 Tax=Rhizosphaericola mali TaxID=2545455 RepID=A0A5P2GA45_9BACT|nr:ribose-5-phosphate isomerase RpiA [Rhizosphaericola mali]QES90063.1 ribose-5-phosphate isomerase RpiA [Rhizosphaericola mali]